MQASLFFEKISVLFPLEERNAGEFSRFELAGMTFRTRCWDARGLGNVSFMAAELPASTMEMNSIIVNPFEVDAPLLSLDRVKVQDKDSLYMELYDTCLDPDRKEERFLEVKDKYSGLADLPQQKNWYDDIRYSSSMLKGVSDEESNVLDDCIREYFDAYTALLKESSPCDPERKKEKARAYSNGLLEHGGPAVNNFLKVWGKEKAEDFFGRVLFG